MPDRDLKHRKPYAYKKTRGFEEFLTDLRKGYCALLLAQMSAAGQHDRSAWKAMQVNVLRFALVA
jgi:hypothetical protein